MRLGLLLLIAAVPLAADSCPWLNAATAAGVLGGPATSATVKRTGTADDAACEFVRREGAAESSLRIVVETMRSPHTDFASYKTRCGANAALLKAIGNQAVACSDGPRAEQVIGRVRDRAFIVRLSAPETRMLREKARQIAGQVAGILF